MSAIHTRTFDVAAESIDANGHVNNLEYLRWMQEVAIEHSAMRGWPVERYMATGGTWVVRTHFIEYLGAAFEGDGLSLHTWVSESGNSSSRRRYLFWRDADRKAIARAETLWVFMDLSTGRARRIPEELKASFILVPSEEEAVQRLGLDRS